MTDHVDRHPPTYGQIIERTRLAQFSMSSDVLTCSLLRTLAASKPAGRFLELGTGTGLSTSWILDGMDDNSSMISIDNDPSYLRIAEEILGADERLSLKVVDGESWIEENRHQRFDYIFADTWPGKYLLIDEVLGMLNKGGLYIIDDMMPQANWPDGHAEKAEKLVAGLEARENLILTKQVWATGIIVAVRR